MSAGFDNTVIVIGGDHHNTLAVVRCLGKQKCNQKLLIHTSKTDVRQLCISHSKYALQKTECIAETEEAIVQWLLEHATEQKQILFPCSDFAAYTIDAHYQQLAPWFVMPGFKGCPGKVVELMDKGRQSEFASKYHIPMARTWRLKNNDGFHIPDDMIYPCIVKPEISAFGSKSDITICNTPDELSKTLHHLAHTGYMSLIVQQFLQKKYEVCAYGCLIDIKEDCVMGMVRKVREFPVNGGGSLTFAQFVEEPEVDALRNRVLDVLYNEGYRGQYDVEFLVCEDGVYLNEINFRHSGNGYGLVQNGVFAPFIWCANAVGAYRSQQCKTSIEAGKYHMDEIPDLRHLKDHHISILQWIGDCMKCSAFAKFDLADLKGTFAWYRPLVKAARRKLFKKQGK